MDWLIGIYKRSFEIVKKNKWLWVFGMILVTTSGSKFSGSFNNIGNFSNSFQGAESSIPGSPTSDFSMFKTVITAVVNILKEIPVSAYATLGVSVVVAVIVSLIIILVVSSWAKGAAIGAVNDAYDNKPVTLRSGSLHGIHSFKRIIWLFIVPWILYFIAVVVPFAIVGVLMAIFWESEVLRLFGILFFVILFFLMFLVSLAICASLIWAVRITVIEKRGAYESFKEGWKLVKSHFLKMIALGCANCLLGCCLTGVVGAIIGGAVVSGVGLLQVNKKVGTVFLTIVVFIVLLLVLLSILFTGIYTVFNVTTWNVLYRQIRGTKE